MTKAEWAVIFALARAAFPSQSLPTETVKAYYELLRHFDGETVLRGVSAHILGPDGSFFPRVHQIVEAVERLREARPEADEVLLEIKQAVKEFGYYRRPEGLSDAAAHVVDTIGWESICDSTNPEALRAHVMKIAEMRSKRRQVRAAINADIAMIGDLKRIGKVPK